MSDQKAFSDHMEKLNFIKRLQARENTFNKFLTGQGILDEGGGMAHGGGLGSGGGLDSSGFKNRRPAVQTAMLSNDKDADDFTQANINLAEIDNADIVEYKDDESLETKAHVIDKKGNPKNITLNGVTKSIWNISDVNSIKKNIRTYYR